jgi:1-acyl-sn-glycerol-3-phosphate acyltransferase
LRVVRVALHLAQGVLTALFFFPIFKQPARNFLIRSWSAKLLAILGIRLTVQGAVPQYGGNGLLFAANHVSWLDIYLLDAIHPLRFVSKSEVRAWPMIGFLAAKVGTLFIERTRRHDTGRVNQDIESALRNGAHVALFPEGTTTDGTHIRNFHASLLQPAIDADAPLQPVAIRYLGENGEIDTTPAYIDDLSFGDSLKRILRCPVIHAELYFAATVSPHGKNRRELAGVLHNAITNALFPVRHGMTPEKVCDHPGAPPSTRPPTDSPCPAPAHPGAQLNPTPTSDRK